MSAPSSQIVALTALELDTLHGAGPLAFQTYVLLRAWMDYRAGIVGHTRPVSLAMLRTAPTAKPTRPAAPEPRSSTPAKRRSARPWTA